MAQTATRAAGIATPEHATVLPVSDDEDRWIAHPVTAAGDTLDQYTDTGGGLVFIARDGFRLGGVALAFRDTTARGDSTFVAPWPRWRPGAGIPEPLGGALASRFVSMDSATARGAFGPGPLRPGRGGLLGADWFAERVWCFDYPAQTLTLLPSTTPAARLGPAPRGGATVPLGFTTGSVAGTPRFPRVTVIIDGDPLDLLFDTGATTELTDEAQRTIGDARPLSRAASFIARSVFERWRARHPEWRVVLHAEVGSGQDMIEVPTVRVADLRSGPVWFTVRPDAAFHQFMSQFMDRSVDGALGGTALRYFRVTVDYPHARATFERPAR